MNDGTTNRTVTDYGRLIDAECRAIEASGGPTLSRFEGGPDGVNLFEVGMGGRAVNLCHDATVGLAGSGQPMGRRDALMFARGMRMAYGRTQQKETDSNG